MASAAVVMADPKQSEERLKYESVALPEETDTKPGRAKNLLRVRSIGGRVAPDAPL